jgi:hypothetical protein
MSIRKYTLEQDEWLLEHYYTVESFSELTDKFNQIFAPTRTQNAIQIHCKNLNLVGIGDQRHYTDDQIKWLRENYNIVNSYADLTDRFNLYFGANRTRDQIREKCNKKLGLTGLPNNTRYGAKEKEQLPVGSIRKSQTGTYIKVLEVPPKSYFSGYAEPYWLPLQKKIYQDAYGKIGEGQMVCFLDGNAENFELDNLYCIDRKISAIMSRNRWWTDSKEHTLTAIRWCELWYVIKEINNVKSNA